MADEQRFRLEYEFLPAGKLPLVLLPLDSTLESKSALPLAQMVGRLLGAMIHVLHVTDEPLSTADLANHLLLTKEESRGLVLDQIKGQPAEVIAKHALEKQATIIVMSLRGHETPPEKPFGPVVRQVIQDAPCPVILIRPELASKAATGTGIKRILLPLDGAPRTAAVIGPAHELAHRNDAELDFLYVLEPGGKGPEEPGTLTYPHYVDQPQHEWPAWAMEFLERFSNCPSGEFHPADECRLFLKRGDPVEEIILFAQKYDVDLIVLEWRGQMDPDHALTVQGVLKNAPSPVLLLRTRES